MRFLGLLLAFLLVVPLLRSVLGALARLFTNFAGSPGPGAAAKIRRVPDGGVLRKDPVCGTYVSEAVAVKSGSGESAVYFCSEECRKKYLSKAS